MYLVLTSCVVSQILGIKCRFSDYFKAFLTFESTLCFAKSFTCCVLASKGFGNIRWTLSLFEEQKTNLMLLPILFHFSCAQHVSDIKLLAPELFFFLISAHSVYKM